MTRRNNLPQLYFTPTDLHILKHATGLFAEALDHNSKALPNMNLAAHSLADLQQKIENLSNQPQMIVEFDFNEAVIIVASLNMYQINIIFSTQNQVTQVTLKNCQSMIAYFTAIQRQMQTD